MKRLTLIFILVLNFCCLSAQNTDIIWTVTMDGHYVATGTFYTDTTEMDAWVVKFNDSDEVIWNRTYYTAPNQSIQNQHYYFMEDKDVWTCCAEVVRYNGEGNQITDR